MCVCVCVMLCASLPAPTCLTYSSSSSLSAAVRLGTTPRPMPPSGADMRPRGGRDACSLAPPVSLCRAFSCEGGNGSSLSVSVSVSPAPAPCAVSGPVRGPPPAAAPTPAPPAFSTLLSRSTARALRGGADANGHVDFRDGGVWMCVDCVHVLRARTRACVCVRVAIARCVLCALDRVSLCALLRLLVHARTCAQSMSTIPCPFYPFEPIS